MRICVVFLAGALLTSGTLADGDIDAPEEAGHQGGACASFGNSFCNGPCKEPPGSNDTFLCECPSDEFYFDAAEQMCLYRKSCKTTKCSLGICKDGRNKVFCSCKYLHGMTLFCKVQKYYKDECEEKGGHVVVSSPWGARCVCGDWATMDEATKKCVPTTCLKPTVTCKELCEKRLLGKDPRCCQGWNETDCTREPENGTYCSPGSLLNGQGKCQDACSANEAKFICANGCQSTPGERTAYQCRCQRREKVAEDGISCEGVPDIRFCRDEEKKACRSDEFCEVHGEKKINCRCRSHEHLLDGICTEKCGVNNCHESFRKCVIYNGKKECRCPWRDWSEIFRDEFCTLKRHYYTVSFKPNISLSHDDCDIYAPRVLEAMKTAIGSRVRVVEILNCTDKIEARLILDGPLPELLRKKLQTCEYEDGEYCMLYPRLPIEKGSATGIEEENLCESVLKELEAAYNGTNICVKDGNLFWFKCAPGFKEVNQETSGRLRRSICQPDKDGPTTEPAGTNDPSTKPATKAPTAEPAGADEPAVDPVTQEPRDDPATKRTTPSPAAKGTTAEPGKSAGSSHFKPQLLQLLLLYGGVFTLLQILLH